jgi:hypothetical protein
MEFPQDLSLPVRIFFFLISSLLLSQSHPPFNVRDFPGWDRRQALLSVSTRTYYSEFAAYATPQAKIIVLLCNRLRRHFQQVLSVCVSETWAVVCCDLIFIESFRLWDLLLTAGQTVSATCFQIIQCTDLPFYLQELYHYLVNYRAYVDATEKCPFLLIFACI